MALTYRHVPRIHRPAWAPVDPYWVERGLLRSWTAGEGTGAPRDQVTGEPLTASATAPVWCASPYGPATQYTAASQHYFTAGDIGAVDGAERLAIFVRGRRRAAGNQVNVGKHSSATSRLGVQWSSDGELYFMLSNGNASSRGHYTQNDALWHTALMVYDGSQATNATRLRAYVDGRDVTGSLTYDATIPATAPSNAAVFEIGRYAVSPLYSQAEIAEVHLFVGPTAVLTATDAQRLHSSPAAIFAPRRMWYPVGAPAAEPTAVASEHSPADLATFQGYGGEISVIWTPIVPANAITDLTLVLNGQTVRDWTLGDGYGAATGVDALVDGKLRISGRGVAYADRANTVETTATTADAHVNEDDWSYSAARQRPASPGLYDALVPTLPPTPALADYYSSALAGTPALTDYATARLGVLAPTSNLVDYAVTEQVGGMFQYTPALTDYLLVDRVAALVCAMAGEVGAFGQAVTPMAGNVHGVSRAQAAALGAAISGTTISQFVAMAAEIGIDAHQLLVAMSAQLGEHGRADTPFAAQIEAIKRKMGLQYHAEPVAAAKSREEI